MKNWENLKSKGIVIGATRYSVQEVDEILIDGKECGGSIDSTSGIIEIGNFVGEGAKVNFVMHEVIHGILQSRGLFSLNDNEEVVDALAEGITVLIRDNPCLVKFIRSKV